MGQHYEDLPTPPKTVSGSTVLQRLVDALGFRYRVATEALTTEDISYRPVPSSMSIEEVNTHIFHLVRLSGQSIQTKRAITYKTEDFEETRSSILSILKDLSDYLSQLTDEDLKAKTVYLKRMDQSFSYSCRSDQQLAQDEWQSCT